MSDFITVESRKKSRSQRPSDTLVSNQRPYNNNQRPIINNQRPIINNQRPIINNQSSYDNNQRPIINNQSPLFKNQRIHEPINNSQNYNQYLRVCRYYVNGNCTKQIGMDNNGKYCEYGSIKNYHFSEEEKNKNHNIKVCGSYCYSPFNCISGFDPWYCIESGCQCDDTKFGNCSFKNKCCSRHDPDYRFKNNLNKNKNTKDECIIEKKITLEDFPVFVENVKTHVSEPKISWLNLCNEKTDIIYKMEKEKPNVLPVKTEEIEVLNTDSEEIKTKTVIFKKKTKKTSELTEEEFEKCIDEMKDIELSDVCDVKTNKFQYKLQNKNQELLEDTNEPHESNDVKSYKNRIMRINNQLVSLEKNSKNTIVVKEKFKYMRDAFKNYQEKLENQKTISNKKMKAYKNELETIKKLYNDLFQEVEKLINDLKISDDESIDEIINKTEKLITDESDDESIDRTVDEFDDDSDDDELVKMMNKKCLF